MGTHPSYDRDTPGDICQVISILYQPDGISNGGNTSVGAAGREVVQYLDCVKEIQLVKMKVEYKC